MTTMKDARRIGDRMLKEHGLDNWTFTFDNARVRAGYCNYRFRRISLSKHFVQLNSTQRIIDTLLHEIAHALVGAGHGHDKVWQAKCLEIGGDGKRCYTEANTTMPTPKYLGVCSKNPLHTWRQTRMSASDKAGLSTCGRCGRGAPIMWSITSLEK